MPSPQPRSARVVLGDTRGDGRALRATWHAEAGVLVLSVWKGNVCTATVRLAPDQVHGLLEALADGLPGEPGSGVASA
ncbi:hypothetical protein [Nocardioides sp. CER19]|uniref:hypothetical protein n=1 Tax=Nocardioides sp. CER19 TaxID=3038538 RepID=UPI00244BD2B1|nr:hypothetical protein [Nocardioides sp. CER19]MDH2415416.1 hypothetical protein [Nocardioides sp. CER19]